MRPADCAPIAAGPLPAVPIVTYAAPIPDEPAVTGGGGATPVGVIAAQAPVAFGPGVTGGGGGTTTGGGSSAGPVPEPATWGLMIVGAGAVGAALRRRRLATRSQRQGAVAVGGVMWGVGSAAEAGDLAVTTTIAAKSTLASVAGKALLCACPAAVVAGSVVGVPAVRHAVHVATAPAPVVALPAVRTAVPCDRPVAVPVSASAVTGFPDTVTTVSAPTTATAVGAKPA